MSSFANARSSRFFSRFLRSIASADLLLISDGALVDRLIRLSIARIAFWSWVAAPASSNMLPSTRDRNELFRWLRATLTKWRLGRNYILWRVSKQHPQRISCIIAHLQQQSHVCDKVHRCSTRTKSVTDAQSQQSRSQMHRANKVSHRCTEPTKSVTEAQSQQSQSQMHRANMHRAVLLDNEMPADALEQRELPISQCVW